MKEYQIWNQIASTTVQNKDGQGFVYNNKQTNSQTQPQNEKYSSNLYSFSRSLMKTHEDAEGVVHEMFLRVWNKRSELLEQNSFKMFLFQLAYTFFVDHFRKRSEDPKYEQFVIHQAQRYFFRE